MGIVPKDRGQAGAGAALLLLSVAAVALFLAARPAFAANARSDRTIVSGAVRSASATELVVNGRAYNISGVPMRTSRMKPVSPAEIAPGTIVDLHFRGGRLISVYVYPNIVN